jgi:hypothetical protein
VLGRPGYALARAGLKFEWADGRGPAVRGTGGRIGTGNPGPFDQVMIDGPDSSSPRDLSESDGNPSRGGLGWRLTLGPSPVMRTGRGDAAHSDELNEGRDGRHGHRDADLHIGDEEASIGDAGSR